MVDLKMLRRKMNLKQTELAEILGCSQVHISYIENGTRNLTDQQYVNLVNHFGQETIEKYETDSAASRQYDDNCNLSNRELLDLLKEQSKQISKFQEQIDVLLSIVAKK